MTFPFGEQVILHRRTKTGVDGYGRDQFTWADYALSGCTYWPIGSVEVVQGQDRVTTTDTVSIPRESLAARGLTAVLDTDEITVRGDRVKVSGKPEDYGPNPFTGRQVPITVRLEGVTG